MKWDRGLLIFIISIAVILLPSALFAEEVYSIKDALVKEVEGKIRVVVSCNAEPQYRYFELEDPPRLVVDFLNATCDWEEKVFDVAKENIYRVRSSQYKTHPVKVTRLVLDLRDHFPYSIFTKENQVIIDIDRPIISEVVKVPPVVKKVPPVVKVVPPVVKEVPPVVKKVPPVVKEVPPVVKKVPPPKEYPLISLNVEDANILSVLRILSEKAGVNIVPSKGVEGKVTVVLRNVPWEKALDMVVKSQGFIYIEEDGIYRVGREEDFERELITEVFPLNYAYAQNILGTVKPVLTRVGKAHVDLRTNSLIIIDTKVGIEKAKGLIERLDTKTEQVMIEALITEMTWTDIDSLGIYWSMYSDDTEFDEDRLEVNLQGGVVPAGTDRGSIIFGIVDTLSFRMRLDALIAKDKVEVLSHPSIISLDNQEAKILAGKDVPYVVTTIGPGGVPIREVKFKEVGVKLTVLPKINPAGYITLKLHPEVSETLYRAPNGEYVIGTQEAETQIIIKDGDTVAIGGMISKKKEVYISKVPILGDFPIIGPLFRKTTSRDAKRNIFIFLTTKII